MNVIAKYCLIFLVSTSHFCALKAESVSIQIDTQRDYEILDQFFRMGISEEGYGYVLEGNKPISIRNFYALDCFPIIKDVKYAEKEFANTLLIREAIPIWKKLCAFQKKFVLKAVPLNAPGLFELGWEVQFINISRLQEVINKNIDLFRYVLGPTLESEQLVNEIAYSGEMLSDILRNDCVLIGIVLGFGSHNSLVGGREETIHTLTISRDFAPFTSKSLAMHNKKEHYGSYYLDVAGGDDRPASFRNDFSHLRPSVGFSSVKEELLAIDAASEPLPSCLEEKQPVFIFSAYKGGPSNQPLFEHLQRSQKQTQVLLKKEDFLERVLEKIGGKKPCITCEKTVSSEPVAKLNGSEKVRNRHGPKGRFCAPKSFATGSSDLPLSFFRGRINVQIWSHILDEVVNRLEDKERQCAFIQSFSYPSAFSAPPMMVGVSKATLKGLKKALQHLSDANAHFETLSKDTSLQAIVPKLLYSKTTFASSGKELKNSDRIRVGYVIEDQKGNILFANHDIWLSLSQTIPGFAHSVQGMRIGEKRLVFIHPALAYGVLTTLPPCIELVVKVELIDIDEKSFGSLPSLTPLDLSWVQNPTLYRNIEESIQQQPHFIGLFYRSLLDKIEDSNKTAIIEELDKRVSKLTKREI